MAKKANVSYDKENDILYVYIGEKVGDSLEIGNFVIDFSHDNKVVGVEIFNASELLNKLYLGVFHGKIPKKSLSGIKDAVISVHQTKELLYIVAVFRITVKNKTFDVPLSVPAPKSLACA
jgi:uncharacterized protein YuzE